VTDAKCRKRLTHLGRKFGSEALLFGLACELVDCATPDELGVDISGYVPIRRAVVLAISMATRFGGLSNLYELIESGQLESTTQSMCEFSQTPRPLTGPVDIVHLVGGRDFEGPYRHCVISHCVGLGNFDTLAEALEFVKARGLELDKVCSCATRGGCGVKRTSVKL
jgi:hypothetical protein